MNEFNKQPATKFDESSQQVLQAIKQAEYVVLVGRNNCGKSYILKNLAEKLGQNASYLGPSRYHNFNLLGHYTPNDNRKQERFTQFIDSWKQNSQNFDNSPFSLQQAISELRDVQRTSLREIIRLLLGADIEILLTVPENSMSQKYVSVGGYNISFTSSGFRLIATLITSLLDDEYDTFLIDEPELGISPEAQGNFAEFLFNKECRAKYFPHIKSLILATHSTIFLDRRTISNNFMVSKNENTITIEQVKTQSDFNRIHFFLLGNRFETLYLPSL